MSYSPSKEDEEKYLADPNAAKHKAEHLEAAAGQLNDVEPYNRPAHYVDIDPVAEAKLRRKLDIRLIPFLTLLYLLNFIDRTAIGNARVAGLEKDLGMTGKYDFSLAQTAFYVIYILVEVPSNMVFKRVGSMWLAFLVVGFGVTTLATAFTKNFGGLIATRIFLGATEGGLLPGIAFLLSRYYRRQELIFRIGFFLALSPSLSGAFGGFLATGFLNSADLGSVVRWRKIFLWEGVLTTIIGLIAFVFLPTWPEKTRMLNEEERRIALARMANEQVNIGKDAEGDSIWKASWNAFTPHSVLCIIGYSCINVSVQGLSTFMPTVIRGLGKFTPTQIQLRTIPPYVVAACWSVFISYLAWKVGRRGVMIMISIPLAILGYIFFLASESVHLRYAGCFLCFTGVVPLGPFFLTWGLNNVPGAQARTILSALIPGLGTIGSVISMWTYLPQTAPNFVPGNALNLSTTSLVFIIAAFLTWYVKWENKRRDRGDLDYRLEGKTESEIKALGHRHPAFRFVE